EVRNEFLDGGTRRRAIFVMATALCLFGSAGTGFLFGSLTGRFLGGAGFGSRTLAFAARIFLGKPPCFFFCPATILVLALTRAVERLGAGSHFFFGQRAQHDAGTRTSGLALLRGCSRLFRRGSSRGRGLRCRSSHRRCRLFLDSGGGRGRSSRGRSRGGSRVGLQRPLFLLFDDDRF